jgi:predicted nucleotidyltransferase
MIRLPEKMRKTLEKIVNELQAKDNVYGIGLFGSWARGEAEPSSDVDLLILDKSEANNEYVERIEANGLLIDLNYIPEKWVHSLIPPELDQKLYEMQVLYDRDWSLTNTKLLMMKSYNSPERVGIRTEAHIVDSDIYLSRATSAYSREDFHSAHLYAAIALEDAMKILVEIALEPFSSSRSLKVIEHSAAKLNKIDVFKNYLTVARLDNVSNAPDIKRKMELFRTMWNEFIVTAQEHSRELEKSHFIVKTKLDYYLSPLFLQGAIMRANSLIDSGRVLTAVHYLDCIFLDVVENYVWLKSSIIKFKVDLSTLLYSVELLENKNPRNFKQTIEFFDLANVGKTEAFDAITKAKNIMFDIRKDRRVLIRDQLSSKRMV